jgi:hypothetical protein
MTKAPLLRAVLVFVAFSSFATAGHASQGDQVAVESVRATSVDVSNNNLVKIAQKTTATTATTTTTTAADGNGGGNGNGSGQGNGCGNKVSPSKPCK